MTYLEYHDDTSSKFWQIAVNGNSHTVTFGKIGTTGQSKTKEFTTEESCQADADKLIKSKKAKGYTEDGEMPTITPNKTTTTKTPAPKIDKQAMLDRFYQLIETGDYQQVVPFLQQYKDGNVTALKKELVKAWKKYITEVSRPLAKQQAVLDLLAFGLLSPSDSQVKHWDWTWKLTWALNYGNKNASFWHNHNDLVLFPHGDFYPILQQLQPTCLNALISQRDNVVHYGILRKFEQMGLIEHDLPVFVRALSCHSLTDDKDNRVETTLADYTQQFVQQDIDPQDLRALFEYENDLPHQWLRGITDKANLPYENIWVYLIAEFVKQGKLDRHWVLQKCIEIQSNLWTVNVKKAYKDIFNNLQPSEQELLNLQEPLFALLHSEFKPSVNFAIEKLKTLLPHAEFQLDEYLAYLTPIMMNSELKGTVKILLSQFTTLLKDQPSRINAIYPLLTTALMINDLNLQERTAKLLAKYATPKQLSEDDWQAVQDNVAMVYDGLGMDVKQILANFMDKNSQENIDNPANANFNQIYTYQPAPIDYFAEENRITLLSDWHELLFAYGQLAYSENPVDFEIFMSSWLAVRQADGLPDDYQTQLKNVIKPHNRWDFSLFGEFNRRFGNYILNQNDKTDNEHRIKKYKFLATWHEVINNFIQLDGLVDSSNDTPPLTLLSLPTHRPAFIEPVALVQRLITYHNANIKVNLTDFSLALARMPRENLEPAIELLKKSERLVSWKAWENGLIIEALNFAFGLSPLPDELPPPAIREVLKNSNQSNQLAQPAEHGELSKKILNQQNKINQEQQNLASISINLLNKLQNKLRQFKNQMDRSFAKTDYQGWRGVWTTIALTHYPTLMLDIEHGNEQDFDLVAQLDVPAHRHMTAYYYHPITEWEGTINRLNRQKIEIGKEVSFECLPYFRYANPSNIYRQCNYAITDRGYFYCLFDYDDAPFAVMARYFTPLNQMANDQFFVNHLCKNPENITKQFLPVFIKLSEPSYPFNAYTQFILASGLFSPAKEIRLATLDIIITAIYAFKFHPVIFAQHSQHLINHPHTSFNRYAEAFQQLSSYEPFCQAVILQAIEATLADLTVVKLPNHFKKYLETYYLLLSSQHQKPSDSMMTQLDNFLTLSASLKPIIGKIKKLGEK